jgi:hypothetical protein
MKISKTIGIELRIKLNFGSVQVSQNLVRLRIFYIKGLQGERRKITKKPNDIL